MVIRVPLRGPFKGIYRDSIRGLLGGSWVVGSGIFSRATIIVSHMKGLETPTYDLLPSRRGLESLGLGFEELGA